MLTQAERRAARIFQQAGVQRRLGPLPPKPRRPGRPRPGGRAKLAWGFGNSGPAKHCRASPGRAGGGTRPYVVRVGLCHLRVANPPCGPNRAPFHDATSEVFGVAFLSDEGTGCYSDVFYDRAMELHADWHVGLSDILGSVMAHELGHLLLGSNSHSPAGVMRAHWQGEELQPPVARQPVVHQRAGRTHARETERSPSACGPGRALKFLSSEAQFFASFASFLCDLGGKKLLTAKDAKLNAKDAKGLLADAFQGPFAADFTSTPDPSFRV